MDVSDIPAALTVTRNCSYFDALCQELDTGHNVVRTRGPSDSRFTFTSHEPGDHAICLSSNYGGSWFGSTHIRLYLDIVVGATKPDLEHDRSHVSALSAKLRELNLKLEDVRREQQYQREREANFRDLSEATNSRAVWYSVVQIVVLVCTCVWQLRHLRVSAALCPCWCLLIVFDVRDFLKIGRGTSFVSLSSYILGSISLSWTLRHSRAQRFLHEIPIRLIRPTA